MKQNKPKRKTALANKAGMTLVEVLVALSLLVVVVFCFTPLFMAYFKNIKISGDIIKSDYNKVGMIERLVGNSGYNQGYEYEVDEIPLQMTVKGTDKTMTAVTNATSKVSAGQVHDIAGNNIISSPDTVSGGFVTFYADAITSSMMCFPSHITDDFKEKTIQVYLSVSKFGTNVKTNMYLSSDAEGKNHISEQYYYIKPTNSGSIMDVVLKGDNDQICFNKSPIYINYKKGYKEYHVKVEIDAPNIIMVGEKSSDGNYYYYVTSGEVNEDGSLDVVAKTMNNYDSGHPQNGNVKLTSAMNDVEWVSAGEGDNGGGGVNEYGYYAMCGDNGQVRRFWKDANGSYYWGGDNTVQYDYRNIYGTETKDQFVKNSTTANYSYVFLNDPDSSENSNNGRSTSGIKLQASAGGAPQLYSNTVFTLNAVNKVPNLKFWAVNRNLLQTFEHTDNDGGWTTSTNYMDDIAYDQFILNNERGHVKDLVLSSNAVVGLSDGALTPNVTENRNDLYSYRDGFDNYFTVKQVDASKVDSYNDFWETNETNYVTLTSVGAIKMENTYASTNGNPSNSYMLYCGYIPAVMDIWSPTRSYGDLTDTTTETLSRWLATFGVAYTEDDAIILKNYPIIRSRKYKNWGTKYVKLAANFWNYAASSDSSYSLSGIVGPENYDSESLRDAQRIIDLEKNNPSEYGIKNPGHIYNVLPLNQWNYQQVLQSQNKTTVSVGYLSNPRAMGSLTNESGRYDITVDEIGHAHVYQWTFDQGTTFLDVDSAQLEDDEGNLRDISMAVGYTLSGLENGYNGGAIVPTVMNCGIVYLRSGGADNEARYSDYGLSQESNIFHMFYYTASYYQKQGSEAILDKVSSAGYWRDALHPLFYSVYGTPYDREDGVDGNDGKNMYSWVASHILFDKKINCVSWGTNWQTAPEAMWGASDGTVMSWWLSNDSSDIQKNPGKYNDESIRAEFQSYNWVDMAKEQQYCYYRWKGPVGQKWPVAIDLRKFTYTGTDKSSATKVLADQAFNIKLNDVNFANKDDKNSGKATPSNQYTVGGGSPDKNNSYLDSRSIELGKDKGKDYTYNLGFVSPLDTIQDVTFANDVWVACGAQGQSYPSYCGSGAVTGSGKGSWIAVRTWYNLNPGVDKTPTDGNAYHTWRAVKISNTENCNIQQVTYINGVWYATGYLDTNDNNTYDDGEHAVIFYATDPSVACGSKGGWTLVKTSGQSSSTYTQACRLINGTWKNDVEIGGVNSMASRTD